MIIDIDKRRRLISARMFAVLMLVITATAAVFSRSIIVDLGLFANGLYWLGYVLLISADLHEMTLVDDDDLHKGSRDEDRRQYDAR